MGAMKAIFTEMQELANSPRFREPDSDEHEEEIEVPPFVLGWETDDGWIWEDIVPEFPY